MADVSQSGDAVAPTYGIDEPKLDVLRITVQIKGLTTRQESKRSFIPFGRTTVPSNGDIVFEAHNKGFLFEFIGRDSLSGQRFRLKVDNLGELLSEKCCYSVQKDAVEIMLKKKLPESWVSRFASGLPVVE